MNVVHKFYCKKVTPVMVKQGTAISSLSQHVPIKLSIHILACQPLDFFFTCANPECVRLIQKKKK